MTEFSFDYKDYHIIVKPEVDGIIEAWCDSEKEKVLFSIQHCDFIRDENDLTQCIKNAIDERQRLKGVARK